MNIPITDEDYYRSGQAFQQQQQWGEAINAYKKALELNSQSRAAVALEYIYEILSFRNTDLLNP
ncbi:MAG: tetratricopeptide repeat protein [Prevotellaceae bacterium]|jgi:tetratricopeptide (TPR) repeat protein|nr:tetratricopeptide repeat protein [Prevotellaceae bacterium]